MAVVILHVHKYEYVELLNFKSRCANDITDTVGSTIDEQSLSFIILLYKSGVTDIYICTHTQICVCVCMYVCL